MFNIIKKKISSLPACIYCKYTHEYSFHFFFSFNFWNSYICKRSFFKVRYDFFSSECFQINLYLLFWLKITWKYYNVDWYGKIGWLWLCHDSLISDFFFLKPNFYFFHHTCIESQIFWNQGTYSFICIIFI